MLFGLALLLSGCATLRGPGAGQKLDPWESWNRKVFSFNESLDNNVLKPVATVYSNVVPAPVRRGIDNFFGNIGDAWSAVNLVLQGRFKPAIQQTMRFAVNSTFGLVGLIDISTEVGLEKNSEDLGMTFGRWGFGTGAYIVWPLFGPRSIELNGGSPSSVSLGRTGSRPRARHASATAARTKPPCSRRRSLFTLLRC